MKKWNRFLGSRCRRAAKVEGAEELDGAQRGDGGRVPHDAPTVGQPAPGPARLHRQAAVPRALPAGRPHGDSPLSPSLPSFI